MPPLHPRARRVRPVVGKKGLFPWTVSGRTAIEMGADAVDIGKTIHPHPTLGESIGMAAEMVHGSCTDVPPQKK